jgi:hypothetical protein
VLEAILIVSSILLAFAIDAAWSGREQRQQESELLEALRADFERNQVLLEASRTLHETHRAAAQDFLRLSSPGSASPASVIPDRTLLGLVSWHTYDPILGSLDSAVASGRLSLIRDSRLRVALAGWVDSVEDLVEQEVVDRGHAQRFAEIAFEFIPYRSAVFRMGAQESVGRPSTAEADYRGLLESLKAENVAANRVAEIGFILDDLVRVQSELEVILGLLPS